MNSEGTPQLTDDAEALVRALQVRGRPASLATLGRDTGSTDEAVAAAAKELIEAHLARYVRSDRLGLVAFDSGERDSRASPRPPSADAQRLLNALPGDGSTIGNVRLRSLVELSNEAYQSAKQELRAARAIRVGVGYGGTVARAAALPQPAQRASGLVRRERDLYEPFVAWLRSTGADQDARFFHARITASPSGRTRSSGKWSRPDVTAVQVLRYEWLPNIVLEVSSFEIKRAEDALSLESVYEAAAHGRWAHRPSLVLEMDPSRGEPPDRFLDEIRRFGLGLYLLSHAHGPAMEVQQLSDPTLHEPDPAELNELLSYFFQSDQRLRNEFRTAIGR